jgi:hypothetical protein
LPKPNYQFEKRKRDMDKKAKKEEKKLRKLQVNESPNDEAGESAVEEGDGVVKGDD